MRDQIFAASVRRSSHDCSSSLCGGVEQGTTGPSRKATGLHSTSRPRRDRFADTMTTSNLIEGNHEIDGVELSSVHGNRSSGMEPDCHFFGLIRCILRRGGQHEEVSWGRGRRLFEHPSLVGDVPDIAVA